MINTPKSLPLRGLRLLLGSALVSASFASLEASTVLINENFSTLTTSTGLTQAGWYFRNGDSTGAAWPAPASLASPIGNLSGTVLRGGLTSGTSANTWLLKQWGGTTLTDVGDSLTLSFDAVFSGSDEFNVSFFDAEQTITGNALGGASPIAGASGYGYMQTFGANPVAGVISSTVQTGTQTGANSDVNTLRDSLGSIPSITGSAYNFSLTATKVEDGAQISFYRDGTLLSSWVDTSIVGGMELNTFKIRLTGTTTSRYIDNIVLTQGSAIPEPSTYAAFAGVAVLGLAAGRRRRASDVQ